MKNKLIGILLAISITLTGYAASPTAPDAELLRSLGLYPVVDNQLLPDISFVDQNGKELRLSDFHGSVILLNFWATWCPPCRAEMPSMEELSKKLENSDFVMIPINVQESSELVEAFLEDSEIDFPVYYDFDGSAAREVGIIGFPTSVLIDRDAAVRAAVVGGFEWNDDELVAMLKKWAENNDG